MDSTRLRALPLFLVVGAMLLVRPAPPLQAAESPLVVVVASTSPLNDISHGTLRRLFLGEPTSGPGGRLIPLNQAPGTSARRQFDAAVLDLDPESMTRFWIDQRIRGLAGAPRAVPAAMLTRIISQLGGAVGYVRASDLGPGIKAISIDGKRFGDPGYQLR